MQNTSKAFVYLS